MTIEKLPSGSYRIKQMYKGKYFSITCDHKPSQKEALMLLSDKMQDADLVKSSTSFEKCSHKYIESKSNILSPSTIGGYEKVLRQISDNFKNKNIYDITQLDIQQEINRYAAGRKPKTVANMHGFISAVLGLFRPNMNISTTLPQKVKFEPYTPTEDDIKTILEESKSNIDYHIMFQLGVLGLRRSEACCISPDDIEGNLLSIDKAIVYDKDGKLVIKHMTKTTEGKRTIYLPNQLIEEIKTYGKQFDKLPSNLVAELHRIQDRKKIQRFRFHDLRHFYASYCHAQGMSDADILASGGWQSDYTMKRVYRHAMEEEKIKNQQNVANKILL